MSRITRLGNGSSKELENHEHVLALYFVLQLLPDSSDPAGNPIHAGRD
jgi:hypothetical protein